jgi:ATP-dependent exoDNAse (exonuclease V) beta subunit
VANLQEASAVTAFPNDQQRAAIEAHGNVFVAAGAGTGKTAVLV